MQLYLVDVGYAFPENMFMLLLGSMSLLSLFVQFYHTFDRSLIGTSGYKGK